MLTKLKVYSSAAAVALPVDSTTDETRDLIQIRGITGLNPVKASINTSAYSSISGAALVGTNLPIRNIILTVHPNPDFITWDNEALRRLLYLYFQPESPVQLVFENDVRDPVTIFGYVESCEANPFTQDLEYQVSIICPNPYFTSLNPFVLTGQTSHAEDAIPPQTITYRGDVPAGIKLEIDHIVGNPNSSNILVQTEDLSIGSFNANVEITDSQKFVMSSVPGNKYADIVRVPAGTVISVISKQIAPSVWPALAPGDNPFEVMADGGPHNWTLTYYEYFGGL